MSQPPAFLKIDFSYFCVRLASDPAHYGLFDWEDSIATTSAIWYERAVRFLNAKMEMPMTIGTRKFWNRFNISKKATLYVAESRVSFLHPQVGVNNRAEIVWNFDTTTSMEPWEPRAITNRTWASRLSDHGVNIHHVYPQWRYFNDDEEKSVTSPDSIHQGFPPLDRIPLIETIFLSHSAPECPPWCEREFLSMVESCPVQNKVVIEPAPLLRGWSKERLDKYQAESRKLRVVLDKACVVKEGRK